MLSFIYNYSANKRKRHPAIRLRLSFEILSYCSYVLIKDRGRHVEPSPRTGEGAERSQRSQATAVG